MPSWLKLSFEMYGIGFPKRQPSNWSTCDWDGETLTDVLSDSLARHICLSKSSMYHQFNHIGEVLSYTHLFLKVTHVSPVLSYPLQQTLYRVVFTLTSLSHQPDCENPHHLQQSVRESIELNHFSVTQMHSSPYQTRTSWFTEHQLISLEPS